MVASWIPAMETPATGTSYQWNVYTHDLAFATAKDLWAVESNLQQIDCVQIHDGMGN